MHSPGLLSHREWEGLHWEAEINEEYATAYLCFSFHSTELKDIVYLASSSSTGGQIILQPKRESERERKKSVSLSLSHNNQEILRSAEWIGRVQSISCTPRCQCSSCKLGFSQGWFAAWMRMCICDMTGYQSKAPEPHNAPTSSQTFLNLAKKHARHLPIEQAPDQWGAVKPAICIFSFSDTHTHIHHDVWKGRQRASRGELNKWIHTTMYSPCQPSRAWITLQACLLSSIRHTNTHIKPEYVLTAELAKPKTQSTDPIKWAPNQPWDQSDTLSGCCV